VNTRGQGGDPRHYFVLAYLFFIACYIFMTALAAPIVAVGQQNSFEALNINSSNFTWNASSGVYSNSPDITDLIGQMISFHTQLWMLDTLLILPGAIYLIWVIVSVMVRGT